MSLQFIIGGSGSGKSKYIMDMLLKEAKNNLEKKFFLIVPDQFTMQTQSDIVRASENGCIMNIDVLSFSRLSHRIFEETGSEGVPVLDDTGKNLILRKCAVDIKDQLPFLADKLDRPGFIHEVKSAISEFKQYSINDEMLAGLIEYASANNRKALVKKLTDLSVIYKYFNEYISGNYITTEERLDVLRKDVYRSKLLKNSVVVFDGFTGFTPVQNGVIEALMKVCDRVMVTLTMDKSDMNASVIKEQDLFRLTKECRNRLTVIAENVGCEILPEVVLPLNETDYSPRFAGREDIAFLEQHLYRYPITKYSGNVENISLTRCYSPAEEVKNLAKEIRKLNREGVYYRDIAVVTGNLEEYRREIEKQFADLDIPVFIDESRKLKNNPFIEFIKSGFNLYEKDFSLEAVMQYLRTGFAHVTPKEADILEDYLRETGIKGASRFGRLFVKKTMGMKKLISGKNDTEANRKQVNDTLEEINRIRGLMMDSLRSFSQAAISRSSKITAEDMIKVLYGFITDNDCFGQLQNYSKMFEEDGDTSRALEFNQIYEAVMKLLEQIFDLVGAEEMSIKEFYGIFEAGVDEIKVGIIPQTVDKIIVGDMQRTRLKPVKHLFFIGLNDGWVPASGNKGGIISDSEREFLVANEANVEIAPSPRQIVYIGRFYLYSNLTKPSDSINISYTCIDNDFKSIKESSVVRDIMKLFPELEERVYEHSFEDIDSIAEVTEAFCEQLRNYAKGRVSEDYDGKIGEFATFLAEKGIDPEKLLNKAFARYENKHLDPKVAGILYGDALMASVSRMEKFAGCAYSYFINYGLCLNENSEYGIDVRDLGNIYHGVLEGFIARLEEKGLNWFTVDEEEIEQLVDQIIEDVADSYTDALFKESNANRYVLGRMKKLAKRTISTVAYQIKGGAFIPAGYEYPFSYNKPLDVVNAGSGNNEIMRVNGKIDRFDYCEKDDRVFVRIVDYKSSTKDVNLLALYHGTQLQIVVYMNQAIEAMKKKFPDKEVISGGMFYYGMNNPVIEDKAGLSEEGIEAEIRKALKLKGLVAADADVIICMDKSGNSKSDIIPVSRKKDGNFDRFSSVISNEGMKIISQYADKKLLSMGRKIISGDISVNPKMVKKSDSTVVTDACKYCSYKGMCGFDSDISGYRVEVINKKEDSELLEAMQMELED